MTLVSNRPFAVNESGSAGPFVGGSPDSLTRVHKGQIVSLEEGLDGNRYVLNFLYNPSAISINYNISMDWAPVQGDMGSGNLSGQHVTFPLIFDRTYELWWRGGGSERTLEEAGGTHPSTHGVMHDARILELMIGMYDPGEPPNPSTEVIVHIGAANLWSFNGFIVSLSFNFTHFSQDMVPTRGVAELGFERRWEVGDADVDPDDEDRQSYRTRGTDLSPEVRKLLATATPRTRSTIPQRDRVNRS